MNVLEEVKRVIEMEATALQLLVGQIGPEYEAAIKLLQQCKGKVVVTGVGKSGHVGKKIAASLASTGTPSFFIHSTEGVHGDLGMIEEEDVVILISNSGETAEVLSLLPSLNRIGAKRIAITSNRESTLSQSCNVSIIYQYTKEADHLGLAPTTSATMTLVIGDALAVTLSKLQDFKKGNFHLYHPGGSLGQQLSEVNKNTNG
jgi:arabinose-5-phosphate isomerase